MGVFDDLVREGVGLAADLTSSLRVPVTLYPWTGAGGGFPGGGFGTGVVLTALVEMTQKQVRSASGEFVQQVAVLTFLDPIPPNGAAGRREPIDPRDHIVLPSGYSGPILDVSGLLDAGTNLPFLLKVSLG